MPPPAVKLSSTSRPSKSRSSRSGTKSRSAPSSPVSQGPPIAPSESPKAVLSAATRATPQPQPQPSRPAIINWDVLFAESQAFYQRWFKHLDWFLKTARSALPCCKRRRVVTIKTRGEKVHQPREWSKYAIALLIVTNALLVFFGRGGRGAWGSAQQDSDPRRSMMDSGRGRLKITPEELGKVLTEDVERFAVKIRRQHITTGHGLQGFIQFSSYRTSPYSFVALGLTPLAFHSMFRANSCRWDDNDGILQQGVLTIHFPGEAFRKQYETMILACELKHDIQSKRVATMERPIEALVYGGNLTIVIDNDPVVVYQEPRGAPLWQEPYKEWPHQLSMCTSPVARPLHAERVTQWMHFHSNLHGVDNFMFYDAGGMDYDMGQVLVEFFDRGMVQVQDIRDTLQYDSYHYSQVLTINDCIYRTQFTSKWTLYLDFDQYLSIPPPIPPKLDANASAPPPPAKALPQDTVPTLLGLSLLRFLDLNKKEKWPWVSFGTYIFSVHHCATLPDISEGDEYVVERMIFREAEPYCRSGSSYKNKAKCQKADGQRKYVVNPRKIVAVQMNRVLSGEPGGYNSATWSTRTNFFRGLAERERAVCTYTWERGKTPDRLTEDDVVALLSLHSRHLQKSRT